MTRLLLLKAHISDHRRLLADGRSVAVRAHEDSRVVAASDIIPANWIDGKHTPGGESREYLRPIPAHSPFAGGRRKWCRVHTFKADNSANLMHPSGYVSRHPSPDAAFEHAEQTIYASPKPDVD